MMLLFPSASSGQSMADSLLAFVSSPSNNNPKKRPLFSRYLPSTPKTAARNKKVEDSEDNQSWLENMPDNILNTIVAFGGPDSIAKLTVTGRALHERCSHGGLWQNLCREYGKVCLRVSQSVTIIWYHHWVSHASVIDRRFE
jgi:hypothetical protein